MQDSRRETQTRQVIADAAARVAARGLGALTVGAVAREARVSLRTVYRYFPSRAELLQGVSSGTPAGYPDLGSPLSPRELLYRLPRALAAIGAPGNPADASRSAELEAHELRVAAAIGPLLSNLGPRERQLLLRTVVALTSGRALAAFQVDGGFDAHEAARAITRVVEQVLAGAGG